MKQANTNNLYFCTLQIITLPVFKTLIPTITLLMLLGCEPRDYNIDPIDTYAMYAYLTNTESPNFIISKSSAMGYYNQPGAVKEALIDIENSNTNTSGFNQELAGKYNNPEFIPKPGQEYYIKAKINSAHVLTSNIKMPDLVKFNFAKAEVTQITINNTPAYCDTIYENDANGNPTNNIIFIDCHEATNDTIIEVSVTIDIDDPANDGNYYFFHTQARKIKFNNFEPLGNAWSLDETLQITFHSPEFDDKTLNKNKNRLSFSTDIVNSYWLKIELYSYDEYNYLYSKKNKILNKQQTPEKDTESNDIINFFKPGGIPETEPVILPCNIEGGIGTILATSVYCDSILLTSK